MPVLFDQLKQIKAFIFDVDGVLTDGRILVNEAGEQLRQFNIKDGYALQLAVKRGFPVIAISGGRSLGIKHRLQGLGITDIYLGLESKTEAFEEVQSKYGLKKEEILYMGDDMPDRAVMLLAGLPVCPADAVEEIKAISTYISPKNGGAGCVRDVIEKVLKIQKKWEEVNPSAHDGSLS